METEENLPMTEAFGPILGISKGFEKASQSLYLFFSSTRRSKVKTRIIWALSTDKILEASQKKY